MQCDKLATCPNLCKSGLGRANTLAAWAGWLLVWGRPRVLVHLGQVKQAGAREAARRRKCLPLVEAANKQKRQKGQCNAKGTLNNVGR